jgi:tetratricopeptide (TPR) repeat protein
MNIQFQPTTKQVAALMAAGYRWYEQGRIRDAKRIFKGLTILDTSNVYAHGLLGAIYQKEHKYEEALSRYSSAIALLPQDPNLLTNRGEIYLKIGKLEEAAKDLKKAIDLDPSQKHPAANRARMLVHAVQDALRIPRQ